MPTIFNLDTNKIISDRSCLAASPASSVLSTGSESDSATSSLPASEYRHSLNVCNMEQLTMVENFNTYIMEVGTNTKSPRLEIIEQPIDKFRFRYKSEMHGTHGSLTGLNQFKSKQRSFPTVYLHNFDRHALIRCSLFQVDSLHPFPHSHSLVVRKGNDDIKDPHDVEVSNSQGFTAIFQGMGIIHTAKKFIIDELHNKLIVRKAFDMTRDLTEREIQQLWNQAETEARNMDLNKVCLCFEAFELVGENPISICNPVYSNPIKNMKSALTGELKITRLSSDISEAVGGEDLFLFVEKVGKKNIKVRFFETDENEEPVWEDWGKFSETDVHHQYAIALRTPPYQNQDIEENVHCWIQLVRPSDKSYSDPIQFRYKPRRVVVSRKRARMSTPYSSNELPTTLNQPQTISTEFNKSGIIADVIGQDQDADTAFSEDLVRLVRNIAMNYNTEELLGFINPNDLLDSKEMSMELKNLTGPGHMLKTDSANGKTSTDFNNIGPELLIPLMHKIVLRNTNEVAAKKIRSLFQYEYENNRFILDFLITYSPAIFKHFLSFVDKLNIPDVLGYRNDHGKSCFHTVCENCSNEAIADIVPILIRLGADPNLTDEKGDTVLHVLVREKTVTNCMNHFLKGIYPINSKLNLEIRNDDSFTPLLLAARLNRVRAVEMLLEAGASVNEVHSTDGNNILHIAVTENSEDLVELILKQSTIDVTSTNNANQSPFDLAFANKPQNGNILYLLNSKQQADEQFYSKTYSTEIKTEPYEEYPDHSNFMADEKLYLPTEDNNFDDICLDQLCNLFNRSEKWRKLASCMDLDAFVSVWAASRNPSRMLFKFSEVQGITFGQMNEIFQQLNEQMACMYVNEMIARRLENDY